MGSDQATYNLTERFSSSMVNHNTFLNACYDYGPQITYSQSALKLTIATSKINNKLFIKWMGSDQATYNSTERFSSSTVNHKTFFWVPAMRTSFLSRHPVYGEKNSKTQKDQIMTQLTLYRFHKMRDYGFSKKKTLVNVAVFYRTLTVYLTPGHSKNILQTPRLVQKLSICWYNIGTVDLPVFLGNWVGFMSMSVILCTMPMVSTMVSV